MAIFALKIVQKKILANGDQVFLDDNKRIWDLADFRIVNLEGSITNSNSKLENRRKILLSYIVRSK